MATPAEASNRKSSLRMLPTKSWGAVTAACLANRHSTSAIECRWACLATGAWGRAGRQTYDWPCEPSSQLLLERRRWASLKHHGWPIALDDFLACGEARVPRVRRATGARLISRHAATQSRYRAQKRPDS